MPHTKHALHFYDAATAFRVGATDRQMRNALTQQLMGIKVNLRRKRLSPEVVFSLAQSLRALEGLKELEVDVSFTSIGEHGACQLAQGIGQLRRLQSLELLLAGQSNDVEKQYQPCGNLRQPAATCGCEVLEELTSLRELHVLPKWCPFVSEEFPLENTWTDPWIEVWLKCRQVLELPALCEFEVALFDNRVGEESSSEHAAEHYSNTLRQSF
eukprot:Skav201154  [mRNA]  locus=scaffold1232:110342:114813:- [translate_table: standard]